MINLLKITVGISIVFSLLMYSGQYKRVQTGVECAWSSIMLDNPVSEQRFFQGHCSRGTAIQYFVNQPVTIFGDGPSTYSERYGKMVLGLHGQLLTFYAEIGIVGLIAGYFFLFSMGRKKASINSKVYLFYFFVLTSACLVTNPFVNFGMLLIYNILLSVNLLVTNEISKKETY